MPHKILVIDDHPETLDIIRLVLEQKGYLVVAAQSGHEGLAIARKERPDLILLDVMMPEMDGMEVCRRVRADPDLGNTLIIMFTAVAEAEQKLAGFTAGADDYLTKPTDPDELVDRVKTLLASASQPVADVVQEEQVADKALMLEGPDHASAQPPMMTTPLPTNSHLTVVIGARGGAGATTLAINLAASAAEGEYPTTLIDLDLAQGHIAVYLNQRVSGGLNALAGLPNETLPQRALQQLVRFDENLSLLLTKASLFNPQAQLSGEQTAAIIQALIGSGRYLVADVGRGVTTMTLPILKLADEIIVCLRPERVALSAARQLLRQLQESVLPQATLRAVLLDFMGNANLPRSAIEEFLGHPLLAVIPVYPQEMVQSVNKSVPLVRLFPKAKTTTLFRQLALQLARA
jgi:CheY-like chemotaxis protein